MNLGTILSLLEISLEVFQSERKDRFLKQYVKIKSEYQDELNKGIDNWSDYKLSQLRIDAEQLAELVIAERSSNK